MHSKRFLDGLLGVLFFCVRYQQALAVGDTPTLWVGIAPSTTTPEQQHSATHTITRLAPLVPHEHRLACVRVRSGNHTTTSTPPQRRERTRTPRRYGTPSVTRRERHPYPYQRPPLAKSPRGHPGRHPLGGHSHGRMKGSYKEQPPMQSPAHYFWHITVPGPHIPGPKQRERPGRAWHPCRSLVHLLPTLLQDAGRLPAGPLAWT